MEKKRKTGLILLITFVILIGAGAAYYFVLAAPAGDGTEAETDEEVISVMEAQPGVISVRVEGPSIVEPFRLQEIRATISGAVLSAPSVGDSLTAGDLIVTVDTTNLQISVRQAELNLAQAELDRDRAELTLNQAQATLADRERLYGEGAIARDQLDTARDIVSNADLALQAAVIKVSQNDLSLATAQNALTSAFIRAPFSGVVLVSGVAPGESVNPGTLLLTVADISRVRLSAEVDEYDIGKIEANMQVEISSDALGDESIRSRVERISPAAEIVNNISIFTVTTVVDNAEGRLRPGMSADLSVLVSSDRGLIVPSKVVSTVRDRSYLEIFDGTEVKTIRVTAGADDGVNVAIVDGLEEGALVVVPSVGGLVFSSSESSSGSSIIPISVPGSGGGTR